MVDQPAMRIGAPRAYKVLGVLGKGGFGTVYRAELVGAGGFVRPVALKLLNAEFEDHPEFAQRLRDEARLLGLVRHRAIVGVDELTMLDGHWAVAMELVEGADLQRLLTGGPLPCSAALEVTAEVAGALATAHHALGPDGAPLGLLHRDLKPSNVLLTPNGEVKVVDFGVARGQFPSREAATVEYTFGSPGYMAPERNDLLELPAGDVYGLGVLLFEMVSGERFGKARGNRRRHAARVEEAMAVLERQRVPPEVARLFAEMVDWAPESRPGAREVEREARELRRAVDGPWLRDWVPGALARPAKAPDDREGVFGTPPAPTRTEWQAVPPSSPPPAAPRRAASRSPSAPNRTPSPTPSKPASKAPSKPASKAPSKAPSAPPAPSRPPSRPPRSPSEVATVRLEPGEERYLPPVPLPNPSWGWFAVVALGVPAVFFAMVAAIAGAWLLA